MWALFCPTFFRTHQESVYFMFVVPCIADKICNNCPTRCNTKQSASSIHMFQVSTTSIISSTQNCNYSLRYSSYFCAATSLQRGQATKPIIRSTQNCNYSLQYSSYFCATTSLQRGQAWPRWREVAVYDQYRRL